jgi:HEAT repeat protein
MSPSNNCFNQQGRLANKFDSNSVDSLIKALSNDDGLVRQCAREALVAMDDRALAPLLLAMTSRDHRVRWEATKALGELANPIAAPVLVSALEEEDFDIRWLAADGLIAMRREALLPLLEALLERSDSILLREGAHRVVHALAGRGLGAEVRPLLDAFEDVDPSSQVPLAAEKVLAEILEMPVETSL